MSEESEVFHFEVEREIRRINEIENPKERIQAIINLCAIDQEAKRRLGERVRIGAPDPQSGGPSARDNAGAAQVQSDAAEARGGGDAAGSGAPEATVQSFATGRVVWIDYENWRGERRWRRVLPHGRLRFGSTEFHDHEQWLFMATDLEDGVLKEWAMSGIYQWEPASDQSLPWRQ